jgi:regulator of sigma E protease
VATSDLEKLSAERATGIAFTLSRCGSAPPRSSPVRLFNFLLTIAVYAVLFSALRQDGHGAYVVAEVRPDSPAAAAGFFPAIDSSRLTAMWSKPSTDVQRLRVGGAREIRTGLRVLRATADEEVHAEGHARDSDGTGPTRSGMKVKVGAIGVVQQRANWGAAS